MALAKFLEILAKEQRPLSELIAQLPHYEVYKTKMACPHEKKELVMKTLVDQTKNNKDIRKVDRTDGIKLYVKDGWVLLRPSGTEPIFRVYVEAKEQPYAEHLAATYKTIVETIIQRV